MNVSRRLLLNAALCWATLAFLPAAWAGSLRPNQLRCEYRVDPVGLDVERPRFSWTLEPTSKARGLRQSAFQIRVASSAEKLAQNQGDLWDSGPVATNQTFGVVYAGAPLASRQRAWWSVRVWDAAGEVSAWSPPATWTLGLLQNSDWQALWIGAPVAPPSPPPAAAASEGKPPSTALPASYFRQVFRPNGPVRRATAYVTALGVYELRLNGRRIGEDLLAPEWTSYRKRVAYQTYDVTEHLRAGDNVVGAAVGEGWYAGRLMLVGRYAYGNQPRLLLQLELELTDGTRQTVVSDDRWRCTTAGPIGSAGIYDGEFYDARLEAPGWDTSAFTAEAWQPVEAFARDARRLVWQRNEPIRVVKEVAPVRRTEPKPGVYVFDLGQNLVGWCRIRARGTAGRTVTIRHAEMLQDDGTLYTANLRGAPQVDRYVPRSEGEFTFEPHFTYHGFRFVELSGLAEPPAVEAVLARVFHSSAPVVSEFDCSEPALTQLQRNILWTQRGNLMSSPNDCPQRDERFGWMGDIQAFAQTAIFHMDLAAYLPKFAQDTRDDQASDGRFPDFAPHPGNPNQPPTDQATSNGAFSGVPAWGDAGVMVPWCAYINYGDTRLLADQFEAARAWIEYIRRHNPDLVWAKGRNNDYNDWLNGDTLKQTGWPTKGGAVPNALFATAFFAHSTELVARMATVLGRPVDARTYAELARQIRAAFQQRFLDAEGRLQGDTQAGYALALHFDLLPESLRPVAARRLVEGIRRYGNHLSTGMQTTLPAMLELTRYGSAELGWQLLTNRTFPSWRYMIDNGATTIWERWDGYVKGRGFQDAGMNSFNHWAFGAVGEWMWRHVIGLNPDEHAPGWARFTIAPRPGGGVTWARGAYDSIRGRIASDWSVAGGRIRLRVTVPPNTTAVVRLPTRDPQAVTEGGVSCATSKEIRQAGTDVEAVYLEVGSGEYDFVAPFAIAGAKPTP